MTSASSEHEMAMNSKPNEGVTRILTVFSVSSDEEDHVKLQQILTGSRHIYPNFKVETSTNVASALAVLQKCRIPIVLIECELSGSWRDLLEHSSRLPVPPLVIVTSWLADERLWAEALNLCAWDVLAKPFDVREVCRVVESAWSHWSARQKHR